MLILSPVLLSDGFDGGGGGDDVFRTSHLTVMSYIIRISNSIRVEYHVTICNHIFT